MTSKRSPGPVGANRTLRVVRFLVKPVVVLLAVTVGIVLGEGLIRALGLAPMPFPIWVSIDRTAYQRSSNPLLGYELKPNYRDPTADAHENIPSTNSWGQRDVERSLVRQPGRRRVILLGDSVVLGNGIYDVNNTISRQLEERLSDRAIEVLNFGVGGYCTRAEVELLRTKGIQFQPDLVILMFLGNDYEDTNRELNVRLHGGIYPRPEWVKHLFVDSALFRVAALRFNWYHFADETDPARWHAEAIGSHNVERGIAELAKLSKEHHFRTIVAIWPGFADNFIADIWAEPHTPDPLKIERIAEENGIPTYRLDEFFRKDWQSLDKRVSPRAYYSIGDTLHPSEIGARVAAAALQEMLNRQPELLEPTKSE